MIKANIAYEMMEKALDLIPSHESTSTYLSAYGVFNLENGDCVAVRAANHGTFLYNWLKMQDTPFNVDLLTSANIAITFLDGSIPFSQNNNINMDSDAEPPVFVVRQYVYNCAVLDSNDINTIISASKKLISDGVYTDPFHLVTFDLTDKCLCIVLSIEFANLLQHIPSGSLTYLDVTAQLT